MRSAARNSCVCGVNAVTMQPEERLGASASARATAAPTSAVPSTQVQSSAQRRHLHSSQSTRSSGRQPRVCVFSPALPRLLGKAYRARALLWCPQPRDGASVLGHPRRGTQEALSVCWGPPVPAPGVSLHQKSADALSDRPRLKFTTFSGQAGVHVP